MKCLRPKVTVFGNVVLFFACTLGLYSGTLVWLGLTVLLVNPVMNAHLIFVLKDGISRVQSNIQSQAKKRQLRADQAATAMSRIKGVLTYNEFWTVDMVIEAVIEDISLKQRIFVDLEKACNSDCILSTNTSTIDIDLIGAKTRSADRIVGAHFFSPAHVMPLLEIVRSEHTSGQVRMTNIHKAPVSLLLVVRIQNIFLCCFGIQVLLDTLELASRIKKTPVVVGNCTGFCVNRVFFPYTMAASLLLDLGMNPYRIDKVIQEKFGMPVGPFRYICYFLFECLFC